VVNAFRIVVSACCAGLPRARFPFVCTAPIVRGYAADRQATAGYRRLLAAWERDGVECRSRVRPIFTGTSPGTSVAEMGGNRPERTE